MEEAGLVVEVDQAGNLIGRTSDPIVWTGSHLDSVPQGGKFDIGPYEFPMALTVLDTFTGTAGTLLTAHAADTGQAWANHPSMPSGKQDSSAILTWDRTSQPGSPAAAGAMRASRQTRTWPGS